MLYAGVSGGGEDEESKARGRSGELGLWVCPGELSRLLLACFRRQGLDRCDDTSVFKGTFWLA
jgi:hypothetical protein